MPNEVKPLSEKQLAKLEELGHDTNAIGDEEGKAILDEYFANLKPTPKQIAALTKFDYYDEGLSFSAASKRLDELASNGWKKPSGLEV